MTRALLGLGANVGDRLGNLRAAVAGLGRVLDVAMVSPVYETAPMYVEDQDRFLNLALLAETAMAPADLLATVKELEVGLGRTASRRYGPRRIDIDIIFYGDQAVHVDGLDIPHTRLVERAFVLKPAADIAPDWRHPETNHTIAEHLAMLQPLSGIERLCEFVVPPRCAADD